MSAKIFREKDWERKDDKSNLIEICHIRVMMEIFLFDEGFYWFFIELHKFKVKKENLEKKLKEV
jgi:ribonucleotide reductase beta subunit family protein with ferritin-like domain